MTDASSCPHPRLDYLDPGQHRGWVCAECGESGPTTVRATDMESALWPGRVMGVRMLCVCGSGYEWPVTATGVEVGRCLAEHADCTGRS